MVAMTMGGSAVAWVSLPSCPYISTSTSPQSLVAIHAPLLDLLDELQEEEYKPQAQLKPFKLEICQQSQNH